MDDVLHVRGVRKTFEAEGAPVRALRGADLTMRRSEFVAVMGPSGCGKSTLLNLIAGLDTADEGTIVLDGDEVTHDDDVAAAAERIVNMKDGRVVSDGQALASKGAVSGATASAI